MTIAETLLWHWGRVGDAAFSPDSTLLATADAYDNAVHLWDLGSDEPRRTVTATDRPDVWEEAHLAFTSDGRTLLVGRGEIVRGLDAATGDEVWRLTLASSLQDLEADPLDAGRVAAVTWNELLLIDAATGEIVTRLGDAVEGSFVAMALAPGEPWVATISRVSGGDDVLRLWHAAERRELRSSTWRYFGVPDFSPDGDLLAVPQENRLLLIDAATFTGRSWSLDPHRVVAVRFAPDGRLATTDGTEVRLWDPTRPAELLRLRPRGTGAWLRFSPDGRWLASPAGPFLLGLWDLEAFLTAQDVTWLFEGEVEAAGVRTVAPEAILELGLPLPGGALAHFKAGEQEVDAVAFLDEGETVAVRLEGDTVARVFDAASGTELDRGAELEATPRRPEIDDWLARLPSGMRYQKPAEVSPDGSLLAVHANLGETVHLFELPALVQRTDLSGIWGAPSALAFTPDGRRLAVGSLLGEVYVWDVPLWLEISRRDFGVGSVRLVDGVPDFGSSYSFGFRSATVTAEPEVDVVTEAGFFCRARLRPGPRSGVFSPVFEYVPGTWSGEPDDGFFFAIHPPREERRAARRSGRPPRAEIEAELPVHVRARIEATRRLQPASAEHWGIVHMADGDGDGEVDLVEVSAACGGVSEHTCLETLVRHRGRWHVVLFGPGD